MSEQSRNEAPQGSPAVLERAPSAARIAQGPVVIVECSEEIPCNPCEGACRYDALLVGPPLTAVPRLDETRCVGCGLCVARCPGLAIFLVDMTHSDREALVSFPYEYLPLPKPGMPCMAVDREGRVIGPAVVRRTNCARVNDRTPMVTIVVAKDVAMQVRGIERIKPR